MDFELFIDNCDMVMCPSYGNYTCCEYCYQYLMKQQEDKE